MSKAIYSETASEFYTTTHELNKAVSKLNTSYGPSFMHLEPYPIGDEIENGLRAIREFIAFRKNQIEEIEELIKEYKSLIASGGKDEYVAYIDAKYAAIMN